MNPTRYSGPRGAVARWIASSTLSRGVALALSGSLIGLTGRADLSFDGIQASETTSHLINATDWADYVGGSGTFNSANDWGRLYWRGTSGDGQYIHFDLSSLAGRTNVAPAFITLQYGNVTWGGGVDGSFVATANGAWTAGAGQTVPGATPVVNAVNASGSYGNGSSVSWGIGSTPLQTLVDNPSGNHGIAVIGGSGSQLHFTGPMSPYLTAKTGKLSPSIVTGVVTVVGGGGWNGASYSFDAGDSYSAAASVRIVGAVAGGTSGAGGVTINGANVIVHQPGGSANYYWPVDSTTINAGGTLTINGHSHLHSLTLAGGELGGTAVDGTYGGWTFDDATLVTGGTNSTISARQVNLDNGNITVDAGSTLNFSGTIRSGSLTKGGGGAMTLSGVNTHDGGTTVNQGSLELVGGSGGYGVIRGALTVNTGATVSLIGGDGTGMGYQGGYKVTALTLNEGTVVSPGVAHVWNLTGGLTLNGGALRGNNGVSNPNGAQLEWNWADVTVGAAATNTSEIGGRIRIRADGGYAGITFTVGDGSAVTDLLVSAAITEASGGRSITKNGAGTMVLSGTNSYTGPTTVNGGTLSLTTRSLGNAAAVIVATGATINLNFSGSDLVGSLEIDGSGPLPSGAYNSSHPTYGSYFTGSGSLLIPGPVGDADGTWIGLADADWLEPDSWLTNTIASGVDRTATLNAAADVTVSLSAGRTIGNLVFDTSNYTLAGGGTLTLDASGIPDISVGTGRTAVISAPVAGSDGLRKSGPGTLVFSGAKSYAGGTTVDGGTLELRGASAGNGLIPGTVVVNTGATLSLTGGDGTGFGWNNSVTNLIINGGSVSAPGSSHIGFGVNTVLAVNDGGVISGNWQWNGDGMLGVSSAGDTQNRLSGNVNLRADGGVYHTFNVADGAAAVDLLVDATLSDQWPEIGWVPASGLAKTGSGTIKLVGTNTYGGVTIVAGGVLEVETLAPYGVACSLGNRASGDEIGGDVAMLFRGGTLRYAGAAAQSTDRGVRLSTTGGGATIDASGALPSATLRFTATASPNFFEGSGDRVLTLTGSNVGDNLFGMAIGEAGGVTAVNKAGPGRWILAGVSTYSGPTIISNGTLLVDGSTAAGAVSVLAGTTLGGTGVVGGVVTLDGTVAPGAGIGTLTVSNQFTDGATAVYRFELGGTNAPTDYDQLVVSDVHTLLGTLEVVLTNGYVPASGDRFNILTNSALGGLLFGVFSAVNVPALTPGLGWEVQYTGTESASLIVTGTAVVGVSAYEQWAQSIPNPAQRGEQADPDGDGYANLLEYSQGTDATNSADNAKLSLVRTNGQFLVLFNRVNSATDIVYEVEGAYLPTNNATWLGIATNVIGSWGGSTNVNDNNTAAVHRVRVTDLLIGTNRSLRLKVTRP